MDKNELLKELSNINLKDLSVPAINKSRGTKIRAQIKDLCLTHNFKLIDAALNSTYLSIYIRASKYFNMYLHFEFNLDNIETCLDTIKVTITEGLNIKKNDSITVSWDDIEPIMIHFSKTCKLKYPEVLNKFNKKDTVLFKRGRYFYIGIIKDIIKNSDNTYTYELYRDENPDTFLLNENDLYVIENAKAFVVYKKSNTPVISDSPCRQLAATIINRTCNNYDDYFTLEDWLTDYLEGKI